MCNNVILNHFLRNCLIWALVLWISKDLTNFFNDLYCTVKFCTVLFFQCHFSDLILVLEKNTFSIIKDSVPEQTTNELYKFLISDDCLFVTYGV